MLFLDNEPLPWAEWAIEFREKMPSAIVDLIAEKAAASSTADHSKSIRDRIKPLLDLFKVSRYRPTPSGSLLIDDQATTRGGQPKKDAGQSSTRTGGASGGG